VETVLNLGKVEIITPVKYVGYYAVMFDHEGEIGDTENFGDNRSTISVMMRCASLCGISLMN